MKKIPLFLLFLYSSLSLESARIISEGDIANWYINADLVITGRVYKIDIVGNKPDTTWLLDDQIYVNTFALEKYWLKVDSVIKGDYSSDSLIAYTPMTLIGGQGYYLGNHTDSIKRGFGYANYYDDTWYTLSCGERRIIMLREKHDSFEVMYKMQIRKRNFDFLDTVKVWGNDFLFHMPRL